MHRSLTGLQINRRARPKENTEMNQPIPVLQCCRMCSMCTLDFRASLAPLNTGTLLALEIARQLKGIHTTCVLLKPGPPPFRREQFRIHLAGYTVLDVVVAGSACHRLERASQFAW